jgi:hypothetical protein
MNNNLLFSLCIITRFSLAYLAYLLYNKDIRYILSLLFFMMGTGFGYLFITKQRKRGALNQLVWWDIYRPFHSFLYILSSILLINKYQYTYLLIILDTFIGIFGYINKHYLSK